MSAKRQLLLLSSSAPHGYTYLNYARDDIQDLLQRNNVTDLLFIPYALRDHDKYTTKVQNVVEEWGFKVRGIHKFPNPAEAVKSAQALFIGGGNTFQLLKGLYDNNLLEPIRKRVLEDGIPYMGSSAGTNVSTMSICTTNDMPIVYPPSFDALGLVPFNINPHYKDTDVNDKHQGETREERIMQYQEIPGANTVLALREGATLQVKGDKAVLKGVATGRLFMAGKSPVELEIGTDLSYLF